MKYLLLLLIGCTCGVPKKQEFPKEIVVQASTRYETRLERHLLQSKEYWLNLLVFIEEQYNFCDPEEFKEAFYWAKAYDLLWDADKREDFIIIKQHECTEASNGNKRVNKVTLRIN